MRVYPIGLGSPEGTVLEIDGFQVATALDEPTAARDRRRGPTGAYFAAADEQALAGGRTTPSTWRGRCETEHIEVTALLAAAAALLLLVGAGLSLAWFGRAV